MGLCGSRLDKLTYEETPEITYDFNKAKVLKVYDGDTFTIGAYHLGKPIKFSVRLYGVDCPELKGPTAEEGKKAKKFVEDLILDKIIKIEVLNNKVLDGKKIREKYGRLLSKVYINGKDLSEELIAMGMAKRYFGGTK